MLIAVSISHKSWHLQIEFVTPDSSDYGKWKHKLNTQSVAKWMFAKLALLNILYSIIGEHSSVYILISHAWSQSNGLYKRLHCFIKTGNDIDRQESENLNSPNYLTFSRNESAS